jgi:catechol 2,3-dioxygenase-like lactoylglutathione lyase family enzyme
VHVQDLYAIVVTDRRAECRDCYVRWFGFPAVFGASWFVHLAATGDHPFGLAFMAPDHPSRPPGPETFGGQGLLITLQVADAAAEFHRLRDGGVAIAYALHDEPWGQRRFAVYDPSGTWVDVVQPIEPAPGSGMRTRRDHRRRRAGARRSRGPGAARSTTRTGGRLA